MVEEHRTSWKEEEEDHVATEAVVAGWYVVVVAGHVGEEPG